MLPRTGLGTFRYDDAQAADAVQTALEMGYRHIDTARMYENERGVGQGIAAANVRRDDIFVTSKVWHENLHRADVLNSIKNSLQLLNLAYLDLALIHWPSPGDAVPMEETLAALDEAKQQGLIRQLGVSNFTEPLLERALRTDQGSQIMTNQVEVHPWLANRALVEYCQRQSVPVTAYMPLAKGRAAEDPTLKAIARKYNADPAQVALSWLLGRDIIVIPASRNPAHQKRNFHARDLQLDAEDRARVDALDQGYRLVNPEFAPNWQAGAA